MAQESKEQLDKQLGDEAKIEEKSEENDDLKVWTDKKLSVLTLDGEAVGYPKKLSLGKELVLRDALSDKLSTIVSLFSTFDDDGDLPEEAFSFFFKDFYQILPKMVSVILSTKKIVRDEEWVKENLDADACQEIIAPFFGSLLRLPPLQMMGMEVPAGHPAAGAGKRKKKKFPSPK